MQQYSISPMNTAATTRNARRLPEGSERSPVASAYALNSSYPLFPSLNASIVLNMRNRAATNTISGVGSRSQSTIIYVLNINTAKHSLQPVFHNTSDYHDLCAVKLAP